MLRGVVVAGGIDVGMMSAGAEVAGERQPSVFVPDVVLLDDFLAVDPDLKIAQRFEPGGGNLEVHCRSDGLAINWATDIDAVSCFGIVAGRPVSSAGCVHVVIDVGPL